MVFALIAHITTCSSCDSGYIGYLAKSSSDTLFHFLQSPGLEALHDDPLLFHIYDPKRLMETHALDHKGVNISQVKSGSALSSERAVFFVTNYIDTWSTDTLWPNKHFCIQIFISVSMNKTIKMVVNTVQVQNMSGLYHQMNIYQFPQSFFTAAQLVRHSSCIF